MCTKISRFPAGNDDDNYICQMYFFTEILQPSNATQNLNISNGKKQRDHRVTVTKSAFYKADVDMVICDVIFIHFAIQRKKDLDNM